MKGKCKRQFTPYPRRLRNRLLFQYYIYNFNKRLFTKWMSTLCKDWFITTVYSIKWAVWLLQLRMVQHWITFQSSVPLVISYICLGFFFSREKPQTISLCNLISAFSTIFGFRSSKFNLLEILTMYFAPEDGYVTSHRSMLLSALSHHAISGTSSPEWWIWK